MSERMQQAAGRVLSASRTGAPLPKLLLGILILGFFVMGSILHIQTSEAFFLGSAPVGLSANWGVLMQPWTLVKGGYTPRMAEAVMWGWGIELMFLLCVFGFDSVHHRVAVASRRMASLFRTGTIILILFDGYTDFQYGNIASGFWGQLAFALILAFVVFYFGTAGWHLIESAFAEWAY